MHQIKIFKGLETDLPQLENQINAWLAESKVRVVQMFGNISPQSAARDSSASVLTKGSFTPSDVLLVVLYEKS